jgi:hypothetical protein
MPPPPPPAPNAQHWEVMRKMDKTAIVIAFPIINYLLLSICYPTFKIYHFNQNSIVCPLGDASPRLTGALTSRFSPPPLS